jgi:hypothetical protein
VQARAMGGGSAVNGLLLTGDEPEHLHGLTRSARLGREIQQVVVERWSVEPWAGSSPPH